MAEFERYAFLPEGFISRAERGLAGGKHNAPLWVQFEQQLIIQETGRW